MPDSVCFIACYNADGDVEWAKKLAQAHIKSILDNTGCKSAEVYLTTGRENFRYVVDPEYKKNRKGVRPEGLEETKAHLLTMYPGELCTAYEADDIVVLRGKSKHTLIAAIDKDVLMQSVGTHYNYRTNEYIKVSRKEAKKFLWIQMIQGDSIDSIYGIEGMGPKKAEKFLSEIEPSLYYNSVLGLYKSQGKSRKEFISNLNLLDMHLLQKDRSIKLHE